MYCTYCEHDVGDHFYSKGKVKCLKCDKCERNQVTGEWRDFNERKM